jgi:hypothetical protein
VPGSPSAADHGRDTRGSRRAAGRGEVVGDGSGAAGPGADIPDGDEVDAAPVSRGWSIAVAAFTALLCAGLVAGALTESLSYALVVFGAQLLFVVATVGATRPPAPRVVAVVGLVAAAGADYAAVWSREASLASLGYATAGAFVLGVIGQLARSKGRVRVTESLGSTLAVVLGVVAFATLIVLGRHPGGTQAIVACLIAAGAAIVVARVTDAVVVFPRLAPQVPRGGLGVVLGAMAGTAGAVLVGSRLEGLSGQLAPTTLAGLATALVAVVVDLSVDYSEAGRRMSGDEDTMWIAGHLQAPLAAFALAAPAAYVSSALLLNGW